MKLKRILAFGAAVSNHNEGNRMTLASAAKADIVSGKIKVVDYTVDSSCKF